MSEESKKSHRQVCSVYNSLNEFDAAEKEQGSVYHGVPKDAWKLEDGDALCVTRMKIKIAKKQRYFNCVFGRRGDNSETLDDGMNARFAALSAVFLGLKPLWKT